MTDPITTPAQMREAAALVERVAAAMWSAEAMRAALNVGHTRTPERFASWLCLAEAAIRAMPVADPLCTWPSCGHTAKGQCRTYTSGQLIAPNDASITATNMPVAEPEPLAVNAVMCAAERDAQSRDAVDLTLFRQAIRAEALEEAAKYHGNFLMTQTSLPVEKIVCSEEAIRALIEKETNE